MNTTGNWDNLETIKLVARTRRVRPMETMVDSSTPPVRDPLTVRFPRTSREAFGVPPPPLDSRISFLDDRPVPAWVIWPALVVVVVIVAAAVM